MSGEELQPAPEHSARRVFQPGRAFPERPSGKTPQSELVAVNQSARTGESSAWEGGSLPAGLSSTATSSGGTTSSSSASSFSASSSSSSDRRHADRHIHHVARGYGLVPTGANLLFSTGGAELVRRPVSCDDLGVVKEASRGPPNSWPDLGVVKEASWGLPKSWRSLDSTGRCVGISSSDKPTSQHVPATSRATASPEQTGAPSPEPTGGAQKRRKLGPPSPWPLAVCPGTANGGQGLGGPTQKLDAPPHPQNDSPLAQKNVNAPAAQTGGGHCTPTVSIHDDLGHLKRHPCGLWIPCIVQHLAGGSGTNVNETRSGGGPLPGGSTPASSPGMTTCPKCERRFNATAAARHIPSCRAKPRVVRPLAGTVTDHLGRRQPRGTNGGGSCGPPPGGSTAGGSPAVLPPGGAPHEQACHPAHATSSLSGVRYCWEMILFQGVRETGGGGGVPVPRGSFTVLSEVFPRQMGRDHSG